MLYYEAEPLQQNEEVCVDEKIQRTIGGVLIFAGSLSLVGAMIFLEDMTFIAYQASTTASCFVIGIGITLRFDREIREFIDRFFGPWR